MLPILKKISKLLVICYYSNHRSIAEGFCWDVLTFSQSPFLTLLISMILRALNSFDRNKIWKGFFHKNNFRFPKMFRETNILSGDFLLMVAQLSGLYKNSCNNFLIIVKACCD